MFEGFINKDRAAARRERKANRAVQLQAGAVAEYISNTKKDEIRFNIGKPPKGLSGKEFMDRVGSTVPALTALGMRDLIVYDQEASERSTDEFEAIRPDTPLPRGAEGVRVVFNRIAVIA